MYFGYDCDWGSACSDSVGNWYETEWGVDWRCIVFCVDMVGWEMELSLL